MFRDSALLSLSAILGMKVTDHVGEQMVLGWGAVLCCMVAAKNYAGLMAARFFLGALEASVGKLSFCLDDQPSAALIIVLV